MMWFGTGCLSFSLSFSSADAGERTRVDITTAEATVKAIFFRAGTVENVQGENVDEDPDRLTRRRDGRDCPFRTPPRTRDREGGGDTGPMKLSRPASWFLLVFGVWSWFIWITFVKNLWQDGSGLAFDDAGEPTGYFWVHLLLAITSFLLGTVVGAIGLRGVRALRDERA